MNEAKSESLKQMKSAGMHHEPEGNIGVLNSNAIFFFRYFCKCCYEINSKGDYEQCLEELL